MNINSDAMISISEANQNFSKVTRLVDQFGSAVILKNNTPRYVIYEFDHADQLEAASDEAVLASSARLLKRNQAVYEELAK